MKLFVGPLVLANFGLFFSGNFSPVESLEVDVARPEDRLDTGDCKDVQEDGRLRPLTTSAVEASTLE